MYQQRHARLVADRDAMAAIAAASSIMSFEADGEAPDRYTFIFHGKGPCSDAQNQVSVCEEHRCLVHLPFAYPQSAPDIQWLTNLFHPNVGYGGFMQLDDVGLQWQEDMNLEVVCERLWDVARMAYVNEEHVANSSAVGYAVRANWNLPLDDRPLRDRFARQVRNVVRYRRRHDAPNDMDVAPLPEAWSSEVRADDVLYIGDEEAE